MTYPPGAFDIQKDNNALMGAAKKELVHDQTVPSQLYQTQQWMAGWITTPLTWQQKLNVQQFPSIEDEACQWIKPSANLKPHERLELYSQQYWWRLLRVLEEQYPLTRRVLGARVWREQVAIPYLSTHIPNHWSLDIIDYGLLDYLKKTPCGAHSDFTRDVAALDYAHLHLNHLASYPPVSGLTDTQSLEQLLDETLYTQPHLFLLEFPADFFAFRKEVLSTSLDNKDYYMDVPLPVLELRSTRTPFVLFRQAGAAQHKQLTPISALYLRRFIAGSSISNSLEWLETQDKKTQEHVGTHLATWLKEWISLNWLTLTSAKEDEEKN